MDIDIRKLQNELKRSGKDVVCIPKDIAEEIREDVYRLLRQYIYNSNGSDYSCAFCFKQLPQCGHREEDEHRPDCTGKKIIAALDDATNP